MKMFFLSRKNLSLKRHIHLVEKTKRFGLSLAPSLLQLAEAVMGRLVAELGTVADRLDVPVMLVSLITLMRIEMAPFHLGTSPGRSS
jgi:hypothetical protein